jgi:hypothetical protein
MPSLFSEITENPKTSKRIFQFQLFFTKSERSGDGRRKGGKETEEAEAREGVAGTCDVRLSRKKAEPESIHLRVLLFSLCLSGSQKAGQSRMARD